MIRTIGACLILGVSGGFGLAKSIGFRRQSRQLRQLITLQELLRCELNYTLLPLPRLCVLTAERCTGAAAQCLLRYGQELEHCGSRHKAAGLALTETKGLCLPEDARQVLSELLESLGRYELEGENRLLRLTGQRLSEIEQRLNTEKRPLARGYAALGFSTGLALVILLL